MCIKYSMNLSKKCKNDLILIISLLLVALIAFSVIQLTKAEGSYAVVVREGEEIAKYSLQSNDEILLQTDDHYNLLVIEDGYAFIKDASCPDKLCVKQGKVHKSGETLVCLPNITTVKIISQDQNDELDLIS